VIPAAPSRLWKTEFPAYSVRNPIGALQKYSRRTRARAGMSGDGVGGAVRPPLFLEETPDARYDKYHSVKLRILIKLEGVAYISLDCQEPK